MPFHFNPSLWFVCKLCRESFPDTDKLKAHKLECHLGDSLHIKCIVFEEKLLDHEWIPPSPAYLSKRDQLLNLSCALTPEINGGDINTPLTEFIGQNQNQKQIKFTNPYVSLKRLTAQELNCATSASAAKIGTAGTQSKVEQNCNNIASIATSGSILSKRKEHFALEVNPFPSKLHVQTDDDDPDDVHQNKIRELLSNAVIIKCEPSNDTDNRAFLKPQDLPISIVSTYSIPSNVGSQINNPINNNSSFNSLQQQPQSRQRQGILEGNSEEAVLPSASTNFSIANIPLVSQIVPISFNQPLQPNYYPGIFNYSTFPEKVEFIEYDLIDQNRNVEMISVQTETEMGQPQQKMLLVNNSNSQFPSEELLSNNNSGSSSDKILLSKPFVCRICSFSFSRNYALTQHLRSHSNSRPFQCPNCDSKFKTKSNLRNHLISRHGFASPFTCQFCGKTSPSKADLITHEASHTGARFYKCKFPNCEGDFVSRSHLLAHTRLVHGKELGLEKFVCSTCGKSFALRYYLNNHAKRCHNSLLQILP